MTPDPLPLPPPEPLPAPRPSRLRRFLLEPLLNLLRTGLTPAALALTVGLGIALGLVPLFGLTILLSTAVALRLRLNVAAMQLAVQLMSVPQLLLLLPLLRWGARLMGQGAAVDGLSVARIRQLFAENPGHLFGLLWRAEAGAVLLWAVASVPLVAVLAFGLRPVFARALRKMGVEEGGAGI